MLLMSGLEEGRHEAPRLGEERELRRGVRRSDGGETHAAARGAT